MYIRALSCLCSLSDERGVTFPTQLVVFSQSQCTVPVGQSLQTVLVGRRDFVENEAFERGAA